MTCVVCWLRRDLRLEDNHALDAAVRESASARLPLRIIFIFDTDILGKLDGDDPRPGILHDRLSALSSALREKGGGIFFFHGRPSDIFREKILTWQPAVVFSAADYEPAARKRDEGVRALVEGAGAAFHQVKDQVIFEKAEVLTGEGNPYTVYTPYMRKWRGRVAEQALPVAIRFQPGPGQILPGTEIPALESLGFSRRDMSFTLPELTDDFLDHYATDRDRPDLPGTSRLSLALRFGFISIRSLVARAMEYEVFLKELIWREFHMNIIWHFPENAREPFRREYRDFPWRKDADLFGKWCRGETGIPIVDAGMRELNETGFMHNRVRMITASFLTKNLLLDYRMGEDYFARKLLDFDLAANNGNWQWVAGCGCDAAPFFRIFNPITQAEKFDKTGNYVRRWVPELQSGSYPAPIVDLKSSRERALKIHEEFRRKKTELR